ncbi:transposable element Tc1 transposase [Trichonephila clavipes]|nr:transposable element Tc1 transposase [Trichonephila clavipes]
MVNNQSVRRHLDAFTRDQIIGKLEEGRSVTSMAAEFGIAHSIVSRLWRQFQTTGTAIRGFSSGRPRGTTPTDDRYIVLQARRNRWQTAGEIARHTTQATGRPISRFTVARSLHGGGLFARRPVRCVPLTPDHRRRCSLWCREHRNWRDNEWGRVLFTDESRLSLSSDSHRILIWRERGSRNHPSNIIERDRYGGRGVLVRGGIMLGSRTDLHIFDEGSVNGTRYCNEILLSYVRLFRGAMGLQFLFMDDNAPCHRAVAAEQLLESEDIVRMDWPARSPDLNPIEHFGLAIHQNDHQARRRFVEWAQNEIAVVPDFHKRILFSDEAHFWLNGYVNKQNCRIWSEANPQVYVETPLHPEKLTVWCSLWAGGIIGPYFFKNDEGHNVTVNGDRYRAMITNFFIPELNNHDVQELWFQQDGATCHTARATIDLLKDTLGDRLISRFGPVNWPPRSCDLTPLDYFLWGYVTSLVYADKPQTLDQLEDNIRRVIADIRPQMLEKVVENWTSRLDYIRASRGCHMPEIIFKM